MRSLLKKKPSCPSVLAPPELEPFAPEEPFGSPDEELVAGGLSGEFVSEELSVGTASGDAAVVFGGDEELVAGGVSGEARGSTTGDGVPISVGAAVPEACSGVGSAGVGPAAGEADGEGVGVCPRDKAAHKTSA